MRQLLSDFEKMTEAIVNLSNNHDLNESRFDDESFIMARILDFNGNLHDENAAVEMIVDGCGRVRNKFQNLALKMADELDATIANHAEEKAEIERQAAEKVEALQRKCDLYERTLGNWIKDTNEKLAENWRLKQSLRTIANQIRNVIAGMSDHDEQQVILDIITLDDNETVEENVENGGMNSDEDDDQGNDEKSSLVNENDAPIEQQNGADEEIEMATDGVSDKENVQPEDATAQQQQQPSVAAAVATAPVPNAANSTSVQVLVPAPVNVSSALVQQNPNIIENGATAIKVERGSDGRKQCFWCEESFIKESSLRNHLKSDHGIVFHKEHEKLKEKLKLKSKELENDDHDEDEPGKYVRPVHLTKRKRSCNLMVANDDDIENRETASQQVGKRKCTKIASEPSMRRSHPRV